MIPVSELYSLCRVENRVQEVPDGQGGTRQRTIKYSVWIDPKADGETPMCAALDSTMKKPSNWTHVLARPITAEAFSEDVKAIFPVAGPTTTVPSRSIPSKLPIFAIEPISDDSKAISKVRSKITIKP